jgi:hemolysin activation/secretion protein
MGETSSGRRPRKWVAGVGAAAFASALLVSRGLLHAQTTAAASTILPNTWATALAATLPATASAGGEWIEVRQLAFEGNTVFTSSELDAVARHGLADARAGRDFSKSLAIDARATIVRWQIEMNCPQPSLRLTADNLETMRGCLTQAYVACGYVNSSVVLPDQDANGGVIKYRCNEGKLSKVNITRVDQSFNVLEAKKFSLFDPRRPKFNPGFIERKIRLSAGKVLNVNTLQNELEILKQNPNLTRVNAELKPDLQPNQSLLDLQLEEANRFHLALDFNNRRSPSVGAERFELIGSDTNVTGFSDPLNFRYTITKGDLEDIGFAGANDYGFDYTHPISTIGTTLQFALDRSDEPIVEAPFDALSIKSETESYGLTLHQPIYQTADTEFGLFATLNLRENKTNLLGKPYEFSPGEDNGKSRVSVLRFGQDFTTRDEQQAFSVRSTFSFGFHAFGSTINERINQTVPDTMFFDWLGQIQYVRRLGNSDAQLIMRGILQLSDAPLLALEQFSIGGFDTVRGYRENEIVRDEGVVGSAEVHIPIFKKGDDFAVILAPFTDIGYGWDYYGSAGSYPVLGSAGIGLIVQATSHVNAQIYYGHPFKYFGRTSNLQDNGIHFDLLVSLF